MIIKYLVKNGANINKKDFLGETPLHKACYLLSHNLEKEQNQIIQFIAPKMKNINSKNKNGYTPLHIAVQYGRLV